MASSKKMSIVDLRVRSSENSPVVIQEDSLSISIQKITKDLSITHLDTDPLAGFELDLGDAQDKEILATINQDILTFVPKSYRLKTPLSFSQKIVNIFDNLRQFIARSMKPAIAFSLASVSMIVVIPILQTIQTGFVIKNNIALQAEASKALVKPSLAGNINETLPQLITTLNDISIGLTTTSEDIQGLSGNLASVSQYLPGLALVDSSSQLVEIIARLTEHSAQLTESLQPFINQDINPFDKQAPVTIVDGVVEIRAVVALINSDLDRLQDHLESLPLSLIPGEEGQMIRSLETQLPTIRSSLDGIDTYSQVFLDFVGYTMKKNYIFMFQNNQELRATGGFIGSYGLMTLDNGVVQNLDIQEIYAPDGQLLKQIIPPRPLQRLTTRWFLRDSNWFADFPTSANNAITFYERTGGLTPDGVISLTPTVIERLLRITGPIAMPEYGVTVDADTFLTTTQHQTSVAYDRLENKPKQFIDDLAPKLINALLTSSVDKYADIFQTVYSSFQEKHILLYMTDPDIQSLVLKYNLGGALYDTVGDYLSVVHTNIGGYKTDGVIEDGIDINTTITQDGKVLHTVSVSRTHKGGNTPYPWWNVENTDYIRFYTPKGSRIISAEGFDSEQLLPPTEVMKENTSSFRTESILSNIEQTREDFDQWDISQMQESGKTVFAGWLVTQPQQTKIVSLTYEVPMKLDKHDVYSLILQKQSGLITMRYNHTIEFPSNTDILWKTSSLAWSEEDDMIVSKDNVIRTDQYISLELKR